MRAWVIVLATTAAATACAWGPQGHEIVAEVAAQELAGTPVAATVKKLLGTDMAKVASWADQVRQASRSPKSPLAHDARVAFINSQFKNNAQWHFVDMPLSTTRYDATAHYTPYADDDAVKAIAHCIRVLEAKSEDKSDLTRAEALRYLIHLVGDIHQPLHSASARFALNGEVPEVQFDAGVSLMLPTDRGGNDVHYGGPRERFSELHAFWDGNMVKAAATGKNYHDIAKQLIQRFKRESFEGRGDYKSWAEQWVVESNAQATLIYRRLKFTGGHETDLDEVHMSIAMPETYSRDHAAIAAEQLVKGGRRLAALLRAIQWPSQ